jgi:hypothetical protein
MINAPGLDLTNLSIGSGEVAAKRCRDCLRFLWVASPDPVVSLVWT